MSRPIIRIFVPLAALIVQVLAIVAGVRFTTAVYDGRHAQLASLDALITHALLGLIAFCGLLALWGLYMLLAYSRLRVIVLMLVACVLPALILASVSCYVLLSFIPLI